MNAVIVIPARYQSSRFPGKPLAPIAGVSMIERVWRIAKAVKNAARVIVATDDQRIFDFCGKFGADVVMTPEECPNGTSRAYAAVQNLSAPPDVVVNFQGDAALTPPWVLEEIIARFADEKAKIVTPAVKLSPEQYQKLNTQKKAGSSSGTLVTFDKNFRALYFSKAMIPFVRHSQSSDLPVYRHIGIYGYRYAALEKYLTLEETPLEKAEGLEQLRALESGIDISVALVDYRGRTHWSVDRPEDVAEAEIIIAREGELY